jgi:hypothetical protein
METHPALLRVIKATLCVHQFQTAHFQEIKRCEQLKKSWKQVQDATKTSKDPKLQKRMQHAKELYEAADAQCKAELDKTEKVCSHPFQTCYQSIKSQSSAISKPNSAVENVPGHSGS